MPVKKNQEAEALASQILAAKKLMAVKKAQDSLLSFMQLRMPDPNDPDNPDASLYEITPQARLLADILEKVYRGELLRVCISIGPQLGKSELISRGFPAWSQGKRPNQKFMLGTYNQDFSEEFGDEVREIIQSQVFKSVFPQCELKKGSRAKDLLKTTQRGQLAFVGRGGSGSGKPADVFVIDDPLKNETEANSPTTRKELWGWFNKVVYARCHKFSAIVIVHTRWHEDDLIGRLCDSEHPDYDEKVAKEWTYINIPAVVKDERLAKALGLKLEKQTDESVTEMFGEEPMTTLWPNRKSLKFLASAKRLAPKAFGALYMGEPTPDDGDFFTSSMLLGYNSVSQLPKDLRIYGASDHALTTNQQNDANVIGCFGVDSNDHIWILPTLKWGRWQSDRTVHEMITLMKLHKPLMWWAEDEHISKGFGPFLRQQQKKEKAYCTVHPIPSKADLRMRCASIQGMMSLQMVHFPVFAHWWGDARQELLKFDNATHDDFVSFMSLVGRGLDTQVGATDEDPDKDKPKHEVGSFGWMKKEATAEKARIKQTNNLYGGF